MVAVAGGCACCIGRQCCLPTSSVSRLTSCSNNFAVLLQKRTIPSCPGSICSRPAEKEEEGQQEGSSCRHATAAPGCVHAHVEQCCAMHDQRAKIYRNRMSANASSAFFEISSKPQHKSHVEHRARTRAWHMQCERHASTGRLMVKCRPHLADRCGDAWV